MFDTFRRRLDALRDSNEVRAFIEHWLETIGRRVTGAVLSTAWRDPAESNGASFVIGRLLLVEAETLRARQPRRYPSVRLEESWIERRDIAGLVATLMGDERDPRLPELFHNPSVERLYSLSSLDSQSEWAETQIRLTCRANRVYPEWLPAVAPGLPPFQTWAQAATTWVWERSVTFGADVPYSGQLVIVLPDTRARAAELAPGEGGFRLLVEVNGPADEYELQFLFSRSRAQLSQGSVEVAGTGEVAIPACPDATQLDVFCLQRTDGLVCHRVFSWSELRVAGSGATADDQELIVEVANGERETVEFKPFVSVESEKRTEIVKTVVAFSNTDGGRIYVGVKDDGQPEGRRGLKKFCSSADPLGLATMLAGLKKLVHDHIKPVPDVVFRPHELAGEPIGIIEVRSGEFVYSTHENDIYIRKGSTNRRPDPTSELPLLAARRRESKTVGPSDVL